MNPFFFYFVLQSTGPDSRSDNRCGWARSGAVGTQDSPVAWRRWPTKRITTRRAAAVRTWKRHRHQKPRIHWGKCPAQWLTFVTGKFRAFRNSRIRVHRNSIFIILITPEFGGFPGIRESEFFHNSRIRGFSKNSRILIFPQLENSGFPGIREFGFYHTSRIGCDLPGIKKFGFIGTRCLLFFQKLRQYHIFLTHTVVMNESDGLFSKVKSIFKILIFISEWAE